MVKQWYKNLLEHEKTRLFQYRKSYLKMYERTNSKTFSQQSYKMYRMNKWSIKPIKMGQLVYAWRWRKRNIKVVEVSNTKVWFYRCKVDDFSYWSEKNYILSSIYKFLEIFIFYKIFNDFCFLWKFLRIFVFYKILCFQ